MSENSPPDILVIGGGVVGLASAFALCEKGFSVAVAERDFSAKESSWAGGGILSALPPWECPPKVAELIARSAEIYPSWVSQLEKEGKIACEFRRCGMLVLPPLDEIAAQKWMSQSGVKAEFIPAKKISSAFSGGEKNALWIPEAAQVRNPRLLRALKNTLANRGVALYDGAEICAFAAEGKKIIAVHSADGRQFAAGNFVVCAGAWSGRLLEKLGDAPSIRPIRGQMLLYRPPPKILPCVAKRGDFYLIPRADGLILAGSTLEDAGFDKRTTGEGVRLISAAAAEILPPLGGLSPILQWAGLRPQTPDDSPLTMRDSRFANLYINSGHYRYGVMLSPASAEILANLIK